MQTVSKSFQVSSATAKGCLWLSSSEGHEGFEGTICMELSNNMKINSCFTFCEHNKKKKKEECCIFRILETWLVKSQCLNYSAGEYVPAK